MGFLSDFVSQSFPNSPTGSVTAKPVPYNSPMPYILGQGSNMVGRALNLPGAYSPSAPNTQSPPTSLAGLQQSMLARRNERGRSPRFGNPNDNQGGDNMWHIR